MSTNPATYPGMTDLREHVVDYKSMAFLVHTGIVSEEGPLKGEAGAFLINRRSLRAYKQMGLTLEDRNAIIHLALNERLGHNRPLKLSEMEPK